MLEARNGMGHERQGKAEARGIAGQTREANLWQIREARAGRCGSQCPADARGKAGQMYEANRADSRVAAGQLSEAMPG
jgi:hypothetical protein